jgi:predicted O-methyltransferase YrrM
MWTNVFSSDAMAAVSMPTSACGGDLLYTLIRDRRPDTVIEFGKSFGISTIHFAATVADNGMVPFSVPN